MWSSADFVGNRTDPMEARCDQSSQEIFCKEGVDSGVNFFPCSTHGWNAAVTDGEFLCR
jgi:hypothetical protein